VARCACCCGGLSGGKSEFEKKLEVVAGANWEVGVEVDFGIGNGLGAVENPCSVFSLKLKWIGVAGVLFGV
jgi:hypothetical protein